MSEGDPDRLQKGRSFNGGHLKRNWFVQFIINQAIFSLTHDDWSDEVRDAMISDLMRLGVTVREIFPGGE